MDKQGAWKKRKAVPAFAAAVFGAWVGAPAVHGDFIVTLSAGKVVGFDTVYEVFAQNTGTGADLSGTKLMGFNLTVTTLSHDLITDSAADIDGDNLDDADITGAPDQHSTPTTTPQFNAATGTFMGIPASPTGKTANVSAETISGVYVNTNTAYYNPSSPAQAIYHSDSGTIDTAFTHGTVSSLEMIVNSSTGVTDTAAVPFANIVVLTGATFTVQGTLTGNSGTAFTIPNTGIGLNNPTSSLTLSVTGTTPNGSNSIGAITLAGSSGKYVPQSTGPIAGGAQTTGYLTVNGFNPTGDSEIYALAVDDNGSLATGNTLAAIISDMNTALQTADGGSASVTTVSPSVGGLFPFANVELILPSGPNPSTASPAILAYDFSNYTANGTVTVTDIGVVPEPASLGALALAGLGLLSRRRRRAAR